MGRARVRAAAANRRTCAMRTGPCQSELHEDCAAGNQGPRPCGRLFMELGPPTLYHDNGIRSCGCPCSRPNLDPGPDFEAGWFPNRPAFRKLRLQGEIFDRQFGFAGRPWLCCQGEPGSDGHAQPGLPARCRRFTVAVVRVATVFFQCGRGDTPAHRFRHCCHRPPGPGARSAGHPGCGDVDLPRSHVARFPRDRGTGESG